MPANLLNPYVSRPAKFVVGLAGSGTVRQIVDSDCHEFKWLGPNAFVLPTEQLGPADAAQLTGALAPSEWVRRLYIDDLPELHSRVQVWPTGVDLKYWSPQSGESRTEKILLYAKGSASVAKSAHHALVGAGYEVHVVQYGEYSQRTYREALRNATALIYCGSSESQGIALLEAWASNVPTLVFSPSQAVIRLSDGSSRVLDQTQFSPAPYLTHDLGRTWTSVEELLDLLGEIAGSLAPRDALGDEWSDRASTMRLLEILGVSL